MAKSIQGYLAGALLVLIAGGSLTARADSDIFMELDVYNDTDGLAKIAVDDNSTCEARARSQNYQSFSYRCEFVTDCSNYSISGSHSGCVKMEFNSRKPTVTVEWGGQTFSFQINLVHQDKDEFDPIDGSEEGYYNVCHFKGATEKNGQYIPDFTCG